MPIARKIRDSARVSEHVAVERGAITVAADGFFHGVARVDLPVQTDSGIELIVPCLVIGDQGIE